LSVRWLYTVCTTQLSSVTTQLNSAEFSV